MQGTVAQRFRMREVDHAYLPHAVARWMSGIAKPQDTTPGVGKHSLRCGAVRANSVVLEFAKSLELSGSQALGHPGTTGNGGRAEIRVGFPQAGVGRGVCLCSVWSSE